MNQQLNQQIIYQNNNISKNININNYMNNSLVNTHKVLHISAHSNRTTGTKNIMIWDEFRHIETIHDFKRLRQNKQKQLIIRMCRKLMEDAKITGYSSVPWKQLSTGRCPFLFVNWPLTITDKALAPGYPTKNDSEPYEPVPFEDISWLGTNQRKTLFMALKSGAVYVRYRYPNEFPTTIVNENVKNKDSKIKDKKRKSSLSDEKQ